jgi:hypothetical protein
MQRIRFDFSNLTIEDAQVILELSTTFTTAGNVDVEMAALGDLLRYIDQFTDENVMELPYGEIDRVLEDVAWHMHPDRLRLMRAVRAEAC